MQQPYSCLIVCILPFINLNILNLRKVFFLVFRCIPCFEYRNLLFVVTDASDTLCLFVLNLALPYRCRHLYRDYFPQMSLALQVRELLTKKLSINHAQAGHHMQLLFGVRESQGS